MKNLNWEIMPHQYDFVFDLKHQEQGFTGGFRAGKSVASGYKSIFLSAIHAGEEGALLSPTYNMTRRNLLPIFRKLNTQYNLGIQGLHLQSPAYITIPWGDKISTIHLDITAENHDRLNGVSLAWAGLDEADKCNNPQTAAECWMQMGSRLSEIKPGTVGIQFATSTPEGFGFMYSTFAENPNPHKKLYKSSTFQNYLLPPGYIEAQKRKLPKHLFRSYMLGDFTNIESNVVYQEYDRDLNDTNLTLEDMKDTETLYLGMDFNNNGMSAVGFIIRDDKEHVIYENIGATNTPQLCKNLEKDLVSKNIKFIVVPDPSCIQHTSVTDDTNLVILRRFKFRIDLMNIAPEIQDRVNSVNARFCNIEGQRNLLINKKTCPLTSKALLMQPYSSSGAPQTKIHLPGTLHTYVDGPLDALGYAVFRKRPLQNQRAKRITITGF